MTADALKHRPRRQSISQDPCFQWLMAESIRRRDELDVFIRILQEEMGRQTCDCGLSKLLRPDEALLTPTTTR